MKSTAVKQFLAAGPFFIVFVLVTVFRIGILAAADIGEATAGLNFSVPHGWRIGYQARGDNRAIVEIIPQEENVQNWTRMITVQKFANSENYHPEKFIDALAESAKAVCPHSNFTLVENVRQDKVESSQKIFICNKNSAPGANEIRNIKAIQSAEYFYVIQIILRRDMTAEHLVAWVRYLGAVTVKGK